VTTIVYGGSLAALVTADQLAAAGSPVMLVTPTPHLGGHFAGTRLGGARFDAGLVIFEYGTLNAQGLPDPLSYDPDVRNDCGRFGRLLARYTESLGIAMHEVPPFRLWAHDRLIPDFVFDTRLDGLRELAPAQRESVQRELTGIVASGEHPLHARRKYREPRYQTLSYAEASRANHGATLHDDCFEPFAQKVTGRSSTELLALYSRAAWLPLFWPETLATALAGGGASLPPTPFHVIRGGAVADLVATLVARLAASPYVRHVVAGVTGLRADRAGVSLDLAEGSARGNALVWGHDLEELARLTTTHEPAKVERASVAIVLARVRRTLVADADLGTVILPGDRSLPYRITNQSTNAGVPDEPMVRLSVEWSGGDAPADDAALLRASTEALSRVGMTVIHPDVADHKILRIRKALVVPNAANRDAIASMREAVAANRLPFLTVAPAAGFGVASLNDQLVQGMQAARRILVGEADVAVPPADGASVTSAAA